MGFWNKLRNVIETKDSLLCVGLDIRPNNLPAPFTRIADFGKAIIDDTLPYACAFKPISPSMRRWGPRDWQRCARSWTTFPTIRP